MCRHVMTWCYTWVWSYKKQPLLDTPKDTPVETICVTYIHVYVCVCVYIYTHPYTYISSHLQTLSRVHIFWVCCPSGPVPKRHTKMQVECVCEILQADTWGIIFVFWGTRTWCRMNEAGLSSLMQWLILPWRHVAGLERHHVIVEASRKHLITVDFIFITR